MTLPPSCVDMFREAARLLSEAVACMDASLDATRDKGAREASRRARERAPYRPAHPVSELDREAAKVALRRSRGVVLMPTKVRP